MGNSTPGKHVSTRDRFSHLFNRIVPDGGSDPDSVAVESPKYSGSDYLIPATDTAGRSSRAQCKVPPLVAREIQEIVTSRKFPFRTDSDVVRWCLIMGLDILAQREPSRGFLNRAFAEMQILEDEENWNVQQQLIKKMDEAVRRHIERDEWGEAHSLVVGALMKFKDSEDSTWRDTTIQEIRTKFKHVLEYGKRTILE